MTDQRFILLLENEALKIMFEKLLRTGFHCRHYMLFI